MIWPSGFAMAVKQPPEIGPTAAARILHDLRLLIGIEPRGCADHEASGFERMLTDVDFCLLCEERTEDRSGIHRRMDLLAVGDQRVAGERHVVLPAGELSNPPNALSTARRPEPSP